MQASVKVIQCPSCGGSSPSQAQQCTYCGNYLLHLTPLERRAPPPLTDKGKDKNESIHYFRSLQFLYRLLLYGGLLMAVIIYGVFFDDFSETELVTISPIWFLLIIFGTCGLYTEKAVRLILDRKANDFGEALNLALKELKSPLMIMLVYVVFSLPFLIFGIKRRFSSPLIISTLTTLLWAGALYFFFLAIFPEL